jgi:hypothetical protein
VHFRFSLPDTVNNPASLVGMGIATAAAALFLILSLLETFGFLVNPYLGLLVFVTLPVVFLAGLALIPFGAWRTARRRRLRPEASDWPVIDLRNPRQRTVAGAVLALTFANVVIVSLAAYGGVHYMESAAFCGQVCHTTMEPEFEAHQAWPHARLACAECHVGPGAGSFVESKLAGTRQLYKLVRGDVPRPIPTPIRALGRPSETCAQCHADDLSRGGVLREIREYEEDEGNSELLTTLHLQVGGPERGIHRHVGLDIEYVTTDARRETIPYVRVTDAAGGRREFTSPGVTPEDIAGGERRRMDCLDCHNRPAHTFDFSPQRAVDAAIARGQISRELPFIRREAVAAVAEAYPDRAAALEAIADRLNGFYAAQRGTDPALLAGAVAGVQGVWGRNVFPRMRVTWGTYPNHLGHVDTPGCFRCHDDDHRTPEGTSISQDCELCHSFN